MMFTKNICKHLLALLAGARTLFVSDAGEEVGESVTVSNEVGVLLNLKKEDPDQLASVGSQVGLYNIKI